MSWPRNAPEAEITDAMRADWQARFGESDRALGFEITKDFKPFSQINDMFTRAFWDPAVKSADSDGFFCQLSDGVGTPSRSGVQSKGFCPAQRGMGDI